MARRMLMVACALVLGSCDSSTGPDDDVRVIDDRIGDGRHRAWRFDLPARGRNYRLEGRFTVTWGGEFGGQREISAYVLDADEYQNFRAGTYFYPLYSRERVSTGSFDVALSRSRQPYYFVLSNRFSSVNDKRVVGRVTRTR